MNAKIQKKDQITLQISDQSNITVSSHRHHRSGGARDTASHARAGKTSVELEEIWRIIVVLDAA
jgi:hypothetical protein